MKTGYQIPHDVLEHYRFRAIELRKEGKRVNDIAHYFGLHRVTVSYWLSAYKKEGERALRSKKAPGPSLKISIDETQKLLQDLKLPATEFGFETPLWTCKRVRYLIHKVMKKNLDNSNVWRLLRRLGLTHQKGERKALEQNPKETKRWLKEIWPQILAHAKCWQAMIYFQNEAGVSVNAVMGKTWSPKGKTPIVKLSGNRGGISISSAISPAGRLLFRVEKGTINAATFIDFLDKIRKHHKNRKVIVIVDRAPAHIAGKVREYVRKNNKTFALYYLPPYSPELNPDENVWGYLKKNKLKSRQAKSKTELKDIAISAMESMQKRPALLKSFFYNVTLS